MINIGIANNILKLKSIEKQKLDIVLAIYNSDEETGYATGMDGIATSDFLEKRFKELEELENSFFLGIESIFEDRLVGVLSGYISGSVLWIRILAIDAAYRKKGYATNALMMLLDYSKMLGYVKDVYLSVSERNIKGLSFWAKNGFSRLEGKNISNLKHRQAQVVIMHKSIN